MKIVGIFQKFTPIYDGLKAEHLISFYCTAYRQLDKIKYVDALCLNLLNEDTKKNNKKVHECIQMIFESLSDAKKPLPDINIYKIMERKDFNDFGISKSNYSRRDIILAEMEYRFRFTTDYDSNLHLFQLLQQETNDPLILGGALYFFEAEQHYRLATVTINSIKNSLGALSRRSVIVESILALIKFRQYAQHCNEIQEEYKSLKLVDAMQSNDRFLSLVDIYAEKALLELLEEVLQHLESMSSQIKDAADLNQLPSSAKLIKVMDNLSASFLQRGYNVQAVKSAMLCHKLSVHKDHLWGKLQSLSFLVKLHQQLSADKKLSKLESCVHDLSTTLEENSSIVESLSISNKSKILYGHLSLAEYYASQNETQKAIGYLKQFSITEMRLLKCDKQHLDFFRILRINYFIIHLQLLKRFKLSMKTKEYQFNFWIMQDISNIKEFKSDFFIHLTNILIGFIKDLGWSSIVSGDLNHVDSYISMIYKFALKYGCALRCLQINNLMLQLNLKCENFPEVDVSSPINNSFQNYF